MFLSLSILLLCGGSRIRTCMIGVLIKKSISSHLRTYLESLHSVYTLPPYHHFRPFHLYRQGRHCVNSTKNEINFFIRNFFRHIVAEVHRNEPVRNKLFHYIKSIIFVFTIASSLISDKPCARCCSIKVLASFTSFAQTKL